jgi:hypothetical protein
MEMHFMPQIKTLIVVVLLEEYDKNGRSEHADMDFSTKLTIYLQNYLRK